MFPSIKSINHILRFLIFFIQTITTLTNSTKLFLITKYLVTVFTILVSVAKLNGFISSAIRLGVMAQQPIYEPFAITMLPLIKSINHIFWFSIFCRTIAMFANLT